MTLTRENALARLGSVYERVPKAVFALMAYRLIEDISDTHDPDEVLLAMGSKVEDIADQLEPDQVRRTVRAVLEEI